jgi:hypothetical protein
MDAIFDGGVPVPATDATISAPVRVSVQTDSAVGAFQVNINDNQGTVAVGGREPMFAFIYAREPWPDIQRTLFAGIGIEDGAWYPFWLYCTSDGKLTNVFWEKTTASGGVYEGAAGTCSDSSGQNFDMQVQVPAHRLSNVALACGFSIRDPTEPIIGESMTALDIEGSQPGVMEYQGDWATILPFNTVDCRSGCGHASWVEVHSILWDPVTDLVGLAIFYSYFDGSSAGVTISSSVVLPGVTPLSESFPNAVLRLNP